LKVTKVEGKCNICGKRFRKLRRERGLSQENVAVKLQLEGLNMTQGTISKIETGKRVIADYELRYLAMVLDISIYELLGIKG